MTLTKEQQAFFVKQHGQEVDWKMVLGVLEEHGMMPMFNILNAICVEDLGFEASLFPKVQFDPFLKERVVREILPRYIKMTALRGSLNDR